MASVNADVVALGTIRAGRLHLHDRRAFDAAIRLWRDGTAVELELTKRRASRSLKQNAYYWGVVVELLSEYTGFTPDDMHDWLKMKFIPKRLAVCDGNGEIADEFVLGGSTRKMTTVQFEDYIETIRRWAATELSVVIPDPERGATMAHVEADGHGWGV